MRPSAQSTASEHRQSRRWVKWTAIIGGTVILLAITISLAALAVWNASPQKALLEASDYALDTPGKYHIDSSAIIADLTYDGTRYALNGTVDTTPVNAVVDGGTLYIKSSDPQRLYDLFTGVSSKTSTSALIQNLLKTMKNRWISINMANPPIPLAGLNLAQCGVNGRIALSRGGTIRKQLLFTYLPHQFLSVENSKATTYNLRINSARLSAFIGDLRTTSSFQLMPSCEQVFDGRDSLSSDITATVTLTKQHVLSSMTLNDNSGSMVKVTANYRGVSQIEIPDATDINQLTGSVFQSFFGQLLSGTE